MSYALETKKRKFDRILESLTDGGASSQSRPSLNSRNNPSTTSLTPDTATDSSKRRRTTPSLLPGGSRRGSTSSLIGHYLPSSRTAFLERLETFRDVTKWHVPSTEPINASVWAKRGWTCVETDTVLCGSCKERVRVDLDLEQERSNGVERVEESHEVVGEEEDDDADESFAVTKDIYDGLVQRYLEMVVTSHAESCPWRKRGCDHSIQRVEGLLNTSNAISALQTRYEGIVSRLREVPKLAPLPQGSQISEQELGRLQFNEKEDLAIDALKLAVCGWQRKCEDVIECRHCFRSLGLWLYRGEEPTMEQLDAVESHLEYCPWRSVEAQDTEVTIASQEDGNAVHRQEKVAGWVLVCQAVNKENVKKRSSATTSAADIAEVPMIEKDPEVVTPEQREKRMKDLLRRIQNLKKPFNVKSLLKKRDKPKA